MLLGLSLTIPRFAPKIDAPMFIELWYDAFKDYPRSIMVKVYEFARNNLEEFPSIAELRFIADEYLGTKKKLYKPVPQYQLKEGEFDALVKELADRADVTKKLSRGTSDE